MNMTLGLGGQARAQLAMQAEKQLYAEQERMKRPGALLGDAPQHVVPISELARELNRLEGAAQHLHRTVDELLERLQPLTAPSPESAGAQCSEPSCGSLVGTNVQHLRIAVDGASARLQVLLATLAI